MYTKLKKSKRIGEKCLFYVVLIIIIVALIGILVLNQRYSNSKIDTEVCKKQLIKKNKALSAENAELRSQMLSSNNDVGHHAYKNAKRNYARF